MLTKLNQNLAFELGSTVEELEALKRTVVDEAQSAHAKSDNV